jgi:hypothetical protein
MERARIPRRYQHCSFESYETRFPGADGSLAAAHLMARRFVDGYPATTEGRGLLLTGSIGVGKTHLAVGILQALIAEKGVRGMFCDYRELLKEIQHSYNPQVATTELEILRPVFEAEVLVLDELGVGHGGAHFEHTLQRQAHHDYYDELCGCRAGRRGNGSAGGDARGDSGRPDWRAHAVAADGDVRDGADNGRGLSAGSGPGAVWLTSFKLASNPHFVIADDSDR